MARGRGGPVFRGRSTKRAKKSKPKNRPVTTSRRRKRPSRAADTRSTGPRRRTSTSRSLGRRKA